MLKGGTIMLPSEKLRKEISETYNINLEQYAWSEELKQQIFSTQLDENIETHATTLKEIYEYGFNIGHCGLTSRYICRKFDDATLFYGKANLLIGTKDSPNGEHAWTILNNYLIDTTLMLCIPKEKAKDLGYNPEKEIIPFSARVLSEYDTYDNDFEKQNINTKKIK